MSGLSFEIKVVVKAFDTDLSECTHCKNEILTTMWKAYLVSGPDEAELERQYCEPCKNLLDFPEG
ncbi:MAG: hypothetical protein ACTHMM_10030 [Agriterribacter sp.]